MLAALKIALTTARPDKILALSTIGAQATRTNLLTQLQMMEQTLGEAGDPRRFSSGRVVHGERRLGR